MIFRSIAIAVAMNSATMVTAQIATEARAGIAATSPDGFASDGADARRRAARPLCDGDAGAAGTGRNYSDGPARVKATMPRTVADRARGWYV